MVGQVVVAGVFGDIIDVVDFIDDFEVAWCCLTGGGQVVVLPCRPPPPCVPAPPQVWPIMGAGYHAIHHTTYIDNYGHYTCTFDSLYGTLTTPEEYREALAKGISVGKLRKQIQQKKRR